VDGGGAGAFFDEALGIGQGEITGTVTARFFHWEMLLAFGITDSEFLRLPVHERREMWTWWRWRAEMNQQLQRRQQAEQEAHSRMGGRGGVG
jgi:hypothetical protein